MSMRWLAAATVAFALLTLASLPLQAQQTQPAPESAQQAPRLLGRMVNVPPPAAEAPAFRSLADSLQWARARDVAHGATERRLVISLFERRLFWMDGVDTLFVAQVAVGSGDTLIYRNNRWEFSTPRGRRVVRAKEPNPVWVPPLWHYVRHARETGRDLVELQHGRPVRLSDGSQVVIRGTQVGQLLPDGTFRPVEQGDHVIFDNTVFVPPFGTINRQIRHELGAYKLDLGNGYLIHGTPHKDSIGRAVTHGCVRMEDEDLAFIYRNTPVRTPVYIY